MQLDMILREKQFNKLWVFYLVSAAQNGKLPPLPRGSENNGSVSRFSIYNAALPCCLVSNSCTQAYPLLRSKFFFSDDVLLGLGTQGHITELELIPHFTRELLFVKIAF